MTSKVLLDTNIFLRFFLRDDEAMYSECQEVLEKISEGKIVPYLSSIALLEFQYVLLGGYKESKGQVIKRINSIMKMRNLVMLDKTGTKSALKLYRKYNVKYGDCLIATQIPKNVPIVTYDRDFKKIKGLQVLTPGEVVSSL